MILFSGLLISLVGRRPCETKAEFCSCYAGGRELQQTPASSSRATKKKMYSLHRREKFIFLAGVPGVISKREPGGTSPWEGRDSLRFITHLAHHRFVLPAICLPTSILLYSLFRKIKLKETKSIKSRFSPSRRIVGVQQFTVQLLNVIKFLESNYYVKFDNRIGQVYINI